MDANGTRFHLLLGQTDWAACADDQQRPLGSAWAAATAGGELPHIGWDPDRAELTLQPRLLRSVGPPAPGPLTPAARRGAASDRYGNWYWLATGGDEILVRSSGTGATTHFWAPADADRAPVGGPGQFGPRQAPPPAAPMPLSGLAVTDDHYLVVGVLRPAGLLIVDLHAGHPPRQLLWPRAVPFAPFDLAARPGGGVWVLDRANARYWALDRHFNVCTSDQPEAALPHQADDFQPRDTRAPRRATASSFPEGMLVTAASPLGATDPVAIEALPDGTVLVLDRAPDLHFGRVWRYRFGQQLGAPASLAPVGAVVDTTSAPGAFALRGHDLAFVPDTSGRTDGVVGRAYVVADDGGQVFALTVALAGDALELAPLEIFLPMRQFGGKALVSAAGQPWYDFADRWLPVLEQPRARYETDGVLATPPLDGREPGCVWHRLLLDACIPAGTGVQVWTRVSDDRAGLATAAWDAEPAPYLRGDGSELPFARQGPPGARAGTWELLFQRARGRYLQIKLALTGSGRGTPRLRALRAYYPRFSYRDHYLPAAYGEDGVSASFIERFLANMEGFYTALEDKVAGVHALFDVRSAPPDTLPWLASWFGLVLDPGWDERRRRLLIRHAMDFFQYRGTLRGIEMALRFVLDDWPDDAIFGQQPWRPARNSAIRIVEEYRARGAARVALGDPTDIVDIRPQLQTASWSPQQGAAALNQRYAAFLRASGLPADPGAPFPLTPPAGPTAAAWAGFARQTLGFVPSAGPGDVPAWRAFLDRRYGSVTLLNAAYATALASVADAPLPAVLPRAAAAVRDWYQFETVVLAMRRLAHRFTVLLPAPTASAGNAAAPGQATGPAQQMLDLAQRLLDLEKPAHTTCQVKLYWALFRVGGVRLGTDTVLDQGSRAPQLMPPLVLQQGALAQSYLAPSWPLDVSDRQILGRDRMPPARSTPGPSA